MYNITSEDYKLIESKDESFYAVELLGTDYAGTKFQFGRVSMREEDGQGMLSFDYDVFDAPELQGDVTFEKIVGDVLVNILESAFESGEYKMGDMNESVIDSDDDIEELAE